MHISKRKGLVALLIAALVAIGIAIGIGGSATADRLLGSRDIKDNSVRSVDVKNGTIKLKDLSPKLVKQLAQLAGQDGADGVNGLNGANGTNGRDGAAGPAGTPGSAAGVQTNWDAKDGATIVDANTVELSNVGTPAGASVEIQNLNLPVQATKTVAFTYELADGAVYAAGSPRVFLEINGNFYNTFDADPSDAGVDNGDGTFTKTWTIPQNGRVGAAGIVVDSGVGTVTVSDVTIDGQVLSFQ